MKKVLGDPPGHGGAHARLRGAAPAFESPSWGFCSVFVLGQPLDKSSRPRDTRRSWFRRLRVALTVEAGAISFGSQEMSLTPPLTAMGAGVWRRLFGGQPSHNQD